MDKINTSFAALSWRGRTAEARVGRRRDGGEGAGIKKILVRHDSLTVARALYKVAALNCSERLIMLCDRARVLARSDRPETMPEIRKRPTQTI